MNDGQILYADKNKLFFCCGLGLDGACLVTTLLRMSWHDYVTSKKLIKSTACTNKCQKQFGAVQFILMYYTYRAHWNPETQR